MARMLLKLSLRSYAFFHIPPCQNPHSWLMLVVLNYTVCICQPNILIRMALRMLIHSWW